MRKVAILTLGLHPRPLVHVIEEKKPNMCYLVASKDGLKYTAKEQGYTKPNLKVIREAARKARCRVSIHNCDPFNPESIGDALAEVLEQIKPEDQVIINYSGGTQVMSLVLGSVAVVLSRIMPIQILYSTARPGKREQLLDHSKKLRELFHRLYEIVPGATR
jgi:hypothetical protein